MDETHEGESATRRAWNETISAARTPWAWAGEAIAAAVAGLVAYAATIERMDSVPAYSIVAAATLGAPALGLLLLLVVQWLRAPYSQRDEARRASKRATTPDADKLQVAIEQLAQLKYGEGDPDQGSYVSATELLLAYADKFGAGQFGEGTFSGQIGTAGAGTFLGDLQIYDVIDRRKEEVPTGVGKQKFPQTFSALTPFGAQVIMALRASNSA